MSFISGPTPPDPNATASTQTSSNISTAIANSFLNNPNQVTNQGSLTYEQALDASGNPINIALNDQDHPGVQFIVPRFQATQKLSPNQETLSNQREGAQIGLATIANTEAERLRQFLSGNVDTAGAPALGDPNTIGGILNPSSTFADAGQQQGSYGADNQRDRVEKSLFERLQPQLDRQRTQLEQRLADQGIRYGSPAYTAAMDDFNRQLTDTRLGITAAGGQEQRLQEDIAAQRAGFANAAQAAAFQQAQSRGQFSNASLAQQLTQRQAALNAQNQTRNQFLSELYASRNQPINEISALLSGSQLTQPQWANWNQAQIPTTDVAGLINQNFSQQSANAQMQSQLLGNVIGAAGRIGSSALISDRRVKDDVTKMGTVFAADVGGKRQQLPIYKYAYKDDPASTQHVGPMAQDVEKIDPRAVASIGGVKHIYPERVMGAILKAA